MHRGRMVLALVLATAFLAPAVAQGQVNIGITIGTPPPPVVVAAPQLVVVPGTPVSYAPGVSFNLFVFGGRYYSLHGGTWFVAATHGGPWTAIAVERVPQPVLAVPVAYYKVPPGHAKKMDGGGPPTSARGHGRGPKWGKGRD